MKWQKLALIAIVMIMLVTPVSAFYGNSSSYTIRGIFGGAGDVANDTYYQFRGLATNQQPTWRNMGVMDFFISGIYPFGISCLQPTNDTTYIIGTDILDQDILICPGTYSNVTFNVNQDNTEIDCAGSTFIGYNSGNGFYISTGINGTIIHDCNIFNYSYAILNIGDYGIFYNNNMSFNSVGARNTPPTINNLWYNNYFSNNSLANAQDLTLAPVNFWNTTKDCYSGFNIIGGLCIGGNFYDDYNGTDVNFDGIGDTLIPYEINAGDDYLPLTNRHELPDAGFLAISFIIGFFSIAFILAYLSTTIGKTNSKDSGLGYDLEDYEEYNHAPLRIYFLLLCLLTIVADLHIMATLERDYLTSLGDLTFVLIDKLPYVLLIVPIAYLLISIINRIYKYNRANADDM